MELEFAADGAETSEVYPFEVSGAGPLVIDWAPMIRAIVSEFSAGTSAPTIAAKFHNTLVEMIVRVAEECGEDKVVMSGGCFQNRLLTERAITRLRDAGFRPYWHQRVPPNDGGIALGQIAAVARLRSKSKLAERETVCA